MPTMPDRVYIDKEDRSLYEKIENENMFKEKTRKEQFLFAMAIGFESKFKRPFNTREGFFLIKDLRPEDEALINAVALHENNSVEVLSDKEKVFKIAEEYAHAGIKLLADRIESMQSGSFYKQFDKELHEIYDGFFK